MSEPAHARRGGNEEPRPDPTPDEQVTGHGDRADHAASTRSWFRRTTPRTVPQAVTPPTWATPSPDDGHATGRGRALHAVPDARPAPEPGKSAAPRTSGTTVRHLTWDEISYFVARDPDKFGEEDFYRDLEFDRVIDREPELE